jgi:hypothetical protein
MVCPETLGGSCLVIRAAGEIKLIATIFLREAWQIRFHASVPPQLSSNCPTNSFHAAATYWCLFLSRDQFASQVEFNAKLEQRAFDGSYF